jgi:UTP--glucose-1-phosphate uridylyltransferase
MSVNVDFTPFAERMTAENLPDIVIRTFRYYYEQLATGATGLIPEDEIAPVDALPDLELLPADLAEMGRAAFSRTVLLKLNGGLGTGMGLEKAKSLLVVKDGYTFLDIVARQAVVSGVPLVLMNSFSTRDDSLEALQRYPDLMARNEAGCAGCIPLDFLQHKAPKVLQAGLGPAAWPQEPELEWCPPGHGDIYTALVTSGMLDRLLNSGIEYAFVSNADNLGAVLDPVLLGYFASRELPFLMEVADRTHADRKGGHLARRASDGRLVLRESAQCSAADMPAFQDYNKHRYFNTNNLWLNLPVLKQTLIEKQGVLGLPLIRNSKTLDPRDASSPPVYQLETAMGAAIGVFEGAGALRVPRTRFAPVKTCADLLAVRSDAYVLTEDWQVVAHPACQVCPLDVTLDNNYYRLIDQLEARFPYGPPSLIECQRFAVKGDVRFGKGIVCRGVVEVVNGGTEQMRVDDGRVLADGVFSATGGNL